MTFGWTHSVIRQISSWAVYSFFGNVEVVNGDYVPKTGPVIMYCFLKTLLASLYEKLMPSVSTAPARIIT